MSAKHGIRSRRTPEPAVLRWLDRQAARSIWITAITLFECRLGLALLPEGRRGSALEAAFTKLLAEDLETRVLPLDTKAAAQSLALAAVRYHTGRPGDIRDTLVAGIARARRAR